MNKEELAYCAGVIDSDGCITIKQKRVSSRRGKAVDQRTYSAAIFVRQVEPGAVTLLHSLFGGSIGVRQPSIPGGRDLLHWEVTCRKAVKCAATLVKRLRIKRKQAEIILEFDKLMRDHKARKRVTWFKWEKGEETITPIEAAAMKGVDPASVYQMISKKTLPVRRNGRRVRIAKRFWQKYQCGDPSRGRLPPEYVALRNDIVKKIRGLNGPTRGVRTCDRPH